MNTEKFLNRLGIIGSTSILAIALAMTPMHLQFKLEDGLSATPTIALADGDGVGDSGNDAGENSSSSSNDDIASGPTS